MIFSSLLSVGWHLVVTIIILFITIHKDTQESILAELFFVKWLKQQDKCVEKQWRLSWCIVMVIYLLLQRVFLLEHAILFDQPLYVHMFVCVHESINIWEKTIYFPNFWSLLMKQIQRYRLCVYNLIGRIDFPVSQHDLTRLLFYFKRKRVG